MFTPIDVSTTALIAQRQRMNTIADNIANVSTTRNADGKPSPFQRRFVTFAAAHVEGAPESIDGVKYEIHVDTTTPARKVYQPGHPDADKEGYVSYPNIDYMTEFVNAMDASRAYQANLVAIDVAKQIDNLSLKILA
jgi:flagellar basal-body rod protein FlgC